MTQKGNIGVTTENIFPVIKKGKKDEMAEKDKKGRCIKVRL